MLKESYVIMSGLNYGLAAPVLVQISSGRENLIWRRAQSSDVEETRLGHFVIIISDSMVCSGIAKGFWGPNPQTTQKRIF